VSTRVFLSPPHLGGREHALLQDAVESNWIAPLGPFVDRFESDLARTTGRQHCVATASGTAAIHLALLTLGVGAGDFVLCQSLTFAGTVNPVVYCGATPVFIDSEASTWNLDPELVREAIAWCLAHGRKPKAMLVVHLYGMPARLAALRALSEEYGIPILEDAAEALGSRYDDQPCGRFGAASILSFNGNKIITTSGGGALVADDRVLIESARHLATQARDPATHYEHSRIGYNYRLSNLLAAVGCAQLEVLEARVAARRRIHEWYRGLPSLSAVMAWQPEPAEAHSNRWLSAGVVGGGLPPAEARQLRERMMAACDRDHIEVRPVWKPMHLQPVFRDAPAFGGSVSQTLFERGLCLPSGSSLTEEQRIRIDAALSAALD
jgi:pyridoxal phosphate-dependent aminotransferase EpsN